MAKGISAGTHLGFLGYYDSNGFLTGGTPTAPANGSATGNPFKHIVGIKEAAPTVGEPETVVITGDDIRLGEFDFESIATRRFNIDVAVFDLEGEADMQGTNVQSIAGGSVGTLDIVDRVERDACIILQGRSKKQDAGLKGLKAYSGVFIPRATVIPLGRVSYSERTGAVYRFSVTPQVSSQHPWGVTLLEANAGTTGASYLPFTFDNPVHIHVFRGDASRVAWTLKHRPISLATMAAWSDRVSLGLSTLDTSTRVLTAASAARAGADVAVLYQFDQFNE